MPNSERSVGIAPPPMPHWNRPSRQVIEHGEPVREVHGIVQREQRDAGAETDALRQHQRLRDEQVGRGRVLPALGQVLADPRLGEPELIREHDLIDVAPVRVGERAVRRVQRHHEQAESHQRLPAGVDVAGPMPHTWMMVSSSFAPS